VSALGQALLEFQKAAPPIHLDATNPHYQSKFASLANVVSTVRPILNQHGLVFTQFPTNIDGAPALETMLIHAESGEDIAAVTPLILAKSEPQGYGSALTYTRRYALLSILGLVGDEDDDANAATPRPNGSVEAAQGDPHGLRTSRADHVPAVTLEEALADPTKLVVHWSRNRGKTLGELTKRQIDWYANEWQPNPDHATDQDWTLKAAAQQLTNGQSEAAVVGAPSDLDDIPFAPSEF
jgi:hypothetical protein